MRSLGTLSEMAGDRVKAPDRPESDTERIIALERRVATLELLLNDVMHHLDTQTQTHTPGKPAASTPKPQKPKKQHNPKPPKQKKKQKQPQPWDDPHRRAEISQLADRILAETPMDSLTKAEVVSRFAVNTKLAGQTLAWMVKKGKMSMRSGHPTEDDSDPQKIFSIKR